MSTSKAHIWEKSIRYVSNGLRVIGTGMLCLLMLLGAGDVIGRYFFNKPIMGTLEVSEILLGGIVFFGWAYTLYLQAHVKVDIFYSRLRPRMQGIVGLFTSFLSLVLFSLIAWQAAKIATTYLKGHRLVPLLNIPLYPFQLFVSLGAVVLCLELIVQIIHLVSQVRKGG